MPGALFDRLKPTQDAIDAALIETLDRFSADAPPRLVEAMRYSLLGGGKRLRPLLCALACEAAGGSLEQALPGACAVEMVHTYSLIHDDLPAMDDDDLRRGRATCHKQFDEATAILAGDALLTMAFEVLAVRCPPKTAAVSCRELARGAGGAGMVGGQALDLEASRSPSGGGFSEETKNPPPDGVRLASERLASERLASERLASIHNMKTGALIRASLRLGVFAAQAENGVDAGTLDAVDAYSAAFGLAFQVTDDLLDVTSTAEKAGKRVGKDAERGKLTYPGLLGLEASRAKAAALGEDAVRAAKSLGPRGETLSELAQYVVTRDR